MEVDTFLKNSRHHPQRLHSVKIQRLAIKYLYRQENQKPPEVLDRLFISKYVCVEFYFYLLLNQIH
jgi:hypothetical protein